MDDTKNFVIIFLFALVKAIVPRYRYDQVNEVRMENIFTIFINLRSFDC